MQKGNVKTESTQMCNLIPAKNSRTIGQITIKIFQVEKTAIAEIYY
jgi:hypothetical protein